MTKYIRPYSECIWSCKLFQICIVYCGVSTPLGCAVVLARAMLGYLCKLLDEGGTKKWKITKILDSPIAA